jgi:hypothetical protein
LIFLFLPEAPSDYDERDLEDSQDEAYLNNMLDESRDDMQG